MTGARKRRRENIRVLSVISLFFSIKLCSKTPSDRNKNCLYTQIMFLRVNTTIVDEDRPAGQMVHFGLLLTLMLVSLPCLIFLLYQLLTTRTLFSSLNNHVVIALLLGNGIQTLMELPMHLSFWYTGFVWPPTLSYCLYWTFMEYYLFTTNALLMVWASAERHILIFDRHLFDTWLKRLCRHYLPICFCFVYPLGYYIGFIFFYPCDSFYDTMDSNCVTACFIRASTVMNIYEQTVHGFVPTLLVVILSISLLVRVLWQKRRMTRSLTWRKNRKMTIQLLSVSCLFFFANVGFYTTTLAITIGYIDVGSLLYAWVYLIAMCLPPLLPFVCLACLPELRSKIKCSGLVRRNRLVRPVTWAVATVGARSLS